MLIFKNNKPVEVCVNPAVFSELQHAFHMTLKATDEKQAPLENPKQQQALDYRKSA